MEEEGLETWKDLGWSKEKGVITDIKQIQVMSE